MFAMGGANDQNVSYGCNILLCRWLLRGGTMSGTPHDRSLEMRGRQTGALTNHTCQCTCLPVVMGMRVSLETASILKKHEYMT